MSYIATITSKRQLTIPSELFKNIKLSEGDKVFIEEKDGNILIKPATALVEELAGSVKVPESLKSIDFDKAIRLAKEEYFSKKGDK
jgi:AbrB family looped-hinge helix DNA binding protein